MLTWVRTTRAPNPALSHPVWWAALALLLVNDHVLKGSDLVPAVVTGKLSDFAGLVVAPPLVACLLGQRRAALGFGLALVGGGFALVKLCPTLADLLGAALSAVGVPSRVWPDPTDLMALPSLLVAWRLMQRRGPDSNRNDVRTSASPPLARAGVVLASIACLATSTPGPRSTNDVQGGSPDRVYVLWGSIRAVDSASGRELGRLALPRTFPEPAWLVAGSALYVADGQSGVRAFDAASLQPLFTTAIDCAGCRMRLAACGDRLFVLMVHPGNAASPRSGWVFALDRASGELARTWRFEPMSGFDQGDADAPACHGESLLTAAPLAVLRFDIELSSPVVVSPQRAPAWLQVVGDALYLASADRVLFELSLSSGAELWRRPIWIEGKAPAFIAARGTLVFTGGEDLIAVDERSKTELWRKHGSFGLLRGADTVLHTDRRGQAPEVLDVRTGKVLWRLPEGTGGDLFAAHGLLLSRSHEAVEAFDARSGAKRWAYSLGAR